MVSGEPLLESFLQDIASSPEKNRVWLRLLSYLEYIGYRKMVKALDHQDVHKGVFHHLTDEIRHSFMLKELAEKSAGAVFSPEEEFPSLREIGESYFQELDAAVHRWVSERYGGENPYLCYLLTSYLIELRAMKVYPLYFSRLKETPAKYVIQQIIRDESEHLHYLQEKMAPLEVGAALEASSLQDFEVQLFAELLEKTSSYLHRLPAVSVAEESLALAASGSA